MSAGGYGSGWEGHVITFNHTIFRDSLTLDQRIATHLEGLAAQGVIERTSTVCLGARNMRVAGTFALAGWNLLLVADNFDGHNGRIELRPHGARIDGMNLTVACRIFSGITAALPGAAGLPGGVGSPGGEGVAGPQDMPEYAGDCTGQIARVCPGLERIGRTVAGGRGGTGGPGQQGQRGGTGGVLVVRHVDSTPGALHVLDAPGGAGGAGGAGGPGGPGGPGGSAVVHWTSDDVEHVRLVYGGTGPLGERGPDGPPGEVGPAGRVDAEQVDEARFWVDTTALLGDSAREWASYRVAVAEYFHRAYNPAVPPRETYMGITRQELDAVRRLDPANRAPARIEAEILAGHNALGLPREMDVTPDFDRYVTAYQQWGSSVFGTLQSGVENLFLAADRQAMANQLTLQRQQIDDTVAVAKLERDAAQTALAAAQKEEEAAKARVEELQRQVEAALAEMENKSIDIGAVVGTVAAVAGAVVSVIAAIPSGGASIVALVPSLMTLTTTVLQNAPAIVGELFKSEQKHLDQVAKAYKDVSKNVGAIIEAGKKVYDLVQVIQKLARGATPDNRKYVELVRAAAEAAHVALLTRLRSQQADLLRQALEVKVDRATALATRVSELQQLTTATSTVLREGASTLIQVAQLQRDTLLGFGFLAQRSVEIYALRDQTANLFLDSGYVHPDLDRDYIEGFVTDVDLATQYQLSWSRFLSPIRMQADYLGYFTDPGHDLDTDIRRLSFTDPEELAEFAATRRLAFTVDVSDLPDDHAETKIQAVAVALPGVTSPSGVVSCQVRHGQVYGQVGADGTSVVQFLRAHTATVAAPVSRLQLGGFDVEPGDPLTAPQAFSLWGRGFAGEWEVTVAESEIELHDVDLVPITEIQVWIAYQFRRVV